MNNVILTGRLTRDPELKYLQGGSQQAYARFTLAVDRSLSKEKKQEAESKNQATADFINIIAWGKLAENCIRYTSKGKRALIQGRIQTGSFVAQDGSRIYTTDVVASNVEFLDWKDSTQNKYEGSTVADGAKVGFEYSNDFASDEDGRIPF